MTGQWKQRTCSAGHGCPNTRHEKIKSLGRAETGSRDRGSDVIAKPKIRNSIC